MGAHDNFFEVGGHSLRLVQLQQRLQEVFAREVRIVDLFRHPTVHAMARHMTGLTAEGFSKERRSVAPGSARPCSGDASGPEGCVGYRCARIAASNSWRCGCR